MHATNKTSEAKTEEINHNYEAITYKHQTLIKFIQLVVL